MTRLGDKELKASLENMISKNSAWDLIEDAYCQVYMKEEDFLLILDKKNGVWGFVSSSTLDTLEEYKDGEYYILYTANYEENIEFYGERDMFSEYCRCVIDIDTAAEGLNNYINELIEQLS